MIKRIPVNKLEVGMYISDLNNDWIPHSNARKKGFIRSEAIIERIAKLGVTELYIDTFRGKDLSEGVPKVEIDRENDQKLEKVAEARPLIRPKTSFADEMIAAQKIHYEAKDLVTGALNDIKLGNAIELTPFTELSDNLLNSVLRNHNALSCLGRIRSKDTYLMEHSVNLSVLMSVFGKSIDLDKTLMRDTVIGALLHDIGKVLVPDEILHKPGKLTDAEFAEMKRHVVHSRDLLKSTPGVAPLTVTVASQHHEKMDGTGYPDGLKGDEISFFGRMVAITDVYDAITADRCYHQGMPPTMAIKKLLEWSDNHLDRGLVTHFIRCIGIYPVGSLVLLESGRLGVVIEANEDDQRLPVIRIMYHTKFRTYLKTEVVDLAKPSVQDRIVKAVNPEDYKINVGDFLV